MKNLTLIIIICFAAVSSGISQKNSVRVYGELAYGFAELIPTNSIHISEFLNYRVTTIGYRRDFTSVFAQVVVGGDYRSSISVFEGSYDLMHTQVQFEVGKNSVRLLDERLQFSIAGAVRGFYQVEDFVDFTTVRKRKEAGMKVAAIAGCQYVINQKFIFESTFDILGYSFGYDNTSSLVVSRAGEVSTFDKGSDNFNFWGNRRMRIGVGYAF